MWPFFWSSTHLFLKYINLMPPLTFWRFGHLPHQKCVTALNAIGRASFIVGTKNRYRGFPLCEHYIHAGYNKFENNLKPFFPSDGVSEYWDLLTVSVGLVCVWCLQTIEQIDRTAINSFSSNLHFVSFYFIHLFIANSISLLEYLFRIWSVCFYAWLKLC